MKQIIGYIKYDYMNIKYGMLFILAVFGIISVVFAAQTGVGAVSYMMFCGLILAGSAFNTTMQSVSFAALAPGSIQQKVAGRYLSGVLCIAASAGMGLLSLELIRLAGALGLVGASGGRMEPPLFLGLFGISLFFMAVQNVLLYLLTPMLGVQFIGFVRMAPGFIMFFGVFSLVKEGNMEIISEMIKKPWLTAGIVFGIGILSLAVSALCSCFILRNRDNV